MGVAWCWTVHKVLQPLVLATGALGELAIIWSACGSTVAFSLLCEMNDSRHVTNRWVSPYLEPLINDLSYKIRRKNTKTFIN